MTSQNDNTKILIVDDVPENLCVLENLLSNLDVEIVKAISGNEALTATLYHDFSLILLDIMMPGMNGFEVAEMLKQDERTAEIPIVFVTAMDKDESKELKAYGKGAVDFLYKPFNKFVLVSKVRALVDLYSMKKNIDKAIFKNQDEKPNILVVDDNPDNIIVLEKLLSRLDVNVITSTSGNEALSKTLYDDFAVIFLDVQMPIMDGYEVAELLKSNDRTSGVPIIFITAIDRDDTKEIKGYDKGAVDFIFKPFNDFILLNKTKIFLDIYKMRSGLEALISEKTYDLRKSNKRLKKEVERKERVEEELRQTKSYLSSVFNSISSILIGMDTNGIITDMNLEAEKSCGVSSKDAQGKSVYEVFPFFSVILSDLMGLVKSQEPIEKSNVAVTVNGVVSYNNFAVYPLIGDNTNQVVIRIDDVTEAKRMQDELQQRRHMDSLGQLAGGISHDFNNMLGAIMGGAEMLSIKAGGNQELEKYITGIKTTVERAAGLTGKLLSFARKQRGAKTPIDMHIIIRDAVDILQRSIDKRINIVLETNASCSMAAGDDSELANVLLNLGINARDAMPDGGTLTISTADRIVREQGISSDPELPDGCYLELCVTDTGVGMTDEVQKKIFEPFFSTKEPGKGTGLGLASVYGTVKDHAGAIEVRSTVGKGSSFSVLLPISDDISVISDLPVEDAVEGKIAGTVLLVDDEETVRAIGSDLLKEIGLEVVTAENGRKAIDIVLERKEEISLILLDMVMPELNGHDCFQEIRKIMPEAKVILCSGYAPEETVAKLLKEGVLDIIQKPFRFAELKKVIHSCLVET